MSVKLRVGIISCFVFLFFSSCFGQTRTFNSTGNWNVATNWAGSNIGDLITENVTMSANPTIVGTDNYTIGNLTPNNGTTLIINSGGVLNVGASGTPKNVSGGSADNVTFTISGKLEVWGNFTLKDNARLNVPLGGQLIVHGNFAMSGDFQGAVNGSVTITGTTSFTDSNATLTGSGSWSSSGCTPSGSNFCKDGQLPVEIIHFNASSNQNSIRLTWSTASELNFDYFDVERSVDAKEFFSIGTVAGHGTSNVRNDYSLIDEKPLIGINYYRLKSVDYDNFTEYFNVVAIDFSEEKYFRISPNPSDGTSLQISLNFIPDLNASLVVYDNLCNVVEYYTPTDHTQSMKFTNSLKVGVYYAKILSGDFVKVERFVVR